MKLFILLILALSITSCASITSGKYHNVKIISSLADAEVRVLDSTYALPANLRLKRAKEDLKITLLTDTISREFIVKSSPNGAFLYGNLLFFHAAPQAYLIDFTNPKRFYYGQVIILNKDDTSSIIRPPILKFYHDYFTRSFYTRKGQMNITISLPYVNSFFLQPQDEGTKSNTGFWGLAAGFEYYYRDRKYLAITGNAVMDYLVPVPVGVDFSGEHESMTSAYLSLTHNNKYGRFTTGYGINFSRNTWHFIYDDRFNPPAPTRGPVRKPVNSLGITINGYHQFGYNFFVGLIYRPTFWKVHPESKFEYEHLITLEFTTKINVNH